MNLSTNNSRVLCFLALIFFNCKKDLNEIGLPLKPQDSIGVFFTDTVSISSSVLLTDTLITSSNAGALVGVQTDIQFGTTVAKSFLGLIPKSVVSGLKNTVVDSVVLSLALASGLDSLQLVGKTNHRILVQQLASPFPITRHYAYESPLPVQSALATGNFSIKPGSILKLYLEKAIGQNLLSLAGDTVKLLSDFKGIALIPDESINKSILTFDLFNTQSALTIYYKDSTSAPKSFLFSLGTNLNTKFYTLHTQRNGSPLESLSATNSLNTLALDNMGFVQNSTGIGTKITFPGIREIVNNKTIIINSATLIVTPADTSSSANNFPLTLFSINANNTVKSRFTVNTANGLESLSQPYNNNLNRYEFNVTSYIQSAVYKNNMGDGIIIAGTSPFNAYGIRLYADNRNLISQNMRMKLLIYYTEVI